MVEIPHMFKTSDRLTHMKAKNFLYPCLSVFIVHLWLIIFWGTFLRVKPAISIRNR